MPFDIKQIVKEMTSNIFNLYDKSNKVKVHYLILTYVIY